MHCGHGGVRGIARRIALVALIAGVPPAEAGSRFGAHYDLGIGAIHTRPYIVGGGICASLAGGISARIAKTVSACVELQATEGTNLPFPLSGDEGPNAGHQALRTVVAGLEVHELPRARGLFVSAGLGAGRSNISGARGSINPYVGRVDLHDRSGLAYGLGLGYRVSGGSALVLFGLRTHGLLRDGFDSSAYATVLSVGAAY